VNISKFSHVISGLVTRIDERIETNHCSRLMVIGDRLRQLRESKNLSQGDIEKRTGLLHCYISRVENGHTVPNVETLEKLAAAFEVPLWKTFYEGSQPTRPRLRGPFFGKSGTVSAKDRKFSVKLERLLKNMNEKDRQLFFFAAQKIALRRRVRRAKTDS
jgi:transcriptional regulator with XRE-family HTH domain